MHPGMSCRVCLACRMGHSSDVKEVACIPRFGFGLFFSCFNLFSFCSTISCCDLFIFLKDLDFCEENEGMGKGCQGVD